MTPRIRLLLLEEQQPTPTFLMLSYWQRRASDTLTETFSNTPIRKDLTNIAVIKIHSGTPKLCHICQCWLKRDREMQHNNERRQKRKKKSRNLNKVHSCEGQVLFLLSVLRLFGTILASQGYQNALHIYTMITLETNDAKNQKVYSTCVQKAPSTVRKRGSVVLSLHHFLLLFSADKLC